MCVEDSRFYSVPCLDKSPSKYEDNYCELNDFYKKIATEELRETDEVRTQSLEQMREFIAKHPHIKKCRTDTQFLLRFLRQKKYILNNATETLERFLAIRALHSEWFCKLDIEDPELSALADTGYLFPLPERDAQGRTVIFNETGQLDPTKFKATHVTRIHALINELFFDRPEVQCAGFVVVYDLSGMTMSHLSMATLNEIRVMAGYLNKAVPVRYREFHFVGTPGATMTVVNMVLNMLSEKLRQRVFCHRSWDELYTKVDKNLLPKEFGGKTPKAECIEQFKQQCSKARARLLTYDETEMEVTKDSKYWQESTDAELESGAIGSFRKLTVD
ncbi:retinaldehyde-binding protein 1-like [Uranotaenia lowii]|uniref:retinaldehyde-binding protein 1-like n=1 Tax=Uranotaenia lowii TaxID=190385 RepID=UPI002479B702|nr:retinaldehyde-binding protein 1-like [Uranotaenia lowii]